MKCFQTKELQWNVKPKPIGEIRKLILNLVSKMLRLKKIKDFSQEFGSSVTLVIFQKKNTPIKIFSAKVYFWMKNQYCSRFASLHQIWFTHYGWIKKVGEKLKWNHLIRIPIQNNPLNVNESKYEIKGPTSRNYAT